MATITSNPYRLSDESRDCDARVILDQIGTMNVMAISGLRAELRPDGVVLPVGKGYSVVVILAGNDTYTVRRTHLDKIVGEETDIYCENVGESAYVASCFVNREFPR